MNSGRGMRLRRSARRRELTWPQSTTSAHRCQFHQHFTRSFFVQKCFAKLFSNYSFALLPFSKIMLAQKLLVKCYWNWLQVSISSTFYAHILSPYFGTKKLQSQIKVEKSCSICFLTKNTWTKCWWNWLQLYLYNAIQANDGWIGLSNTKVMRARVKNSQNFSRKILKNFGILGLKILKFLRLKINFWSRYP